MQREASGAPAAALVSSRAPVPVRTQVAGAPHRRGAASPSGRVTWERFAQSSGGIACVRTRDTSLVRESVGDAGGTSRTARSGISVALCTFQGEEHIAAQLRSIVEQSRPPDELVVSDDGSRDATLKIVDEFARSAPFPVDVSAVPRRLGVTRNFERAIGRCHGEIIVLSDQDDVWLPERLERIEAAFAAEESVHLVFSDAIIDDRRRILNGRRLWRILGVRRRHLRRLERDPLGQLVGRSLVTGSTLAFRAASLPLIRPFPTEQCAPTRLLHDRWISLAVAATHDIKPLNEPLVRYRLHESQDIGIPFAMARAVLPASVTRWRSALVPGELHWVRLRDHLKNLDELARRVERLDSGDRAAAITGLGAAIDHLERRAALPRARSRRVLPVLRELATRRYHRFSLGAVTATADLLRRQP